ncbi:unnamed protein product [Ilex paraguariensis]|uniref:Uncharacterized protein n=1 Tax=Ilex paraguariensis TaxID=185542 RepID=A0ABC8RRX7_9AQUA
MQVSATPMALTSNRFLCNTLTRKPYTHLPLHQAISFTTNTSLTPPRTTFIVSAAKKLSSRTGKFDSKNKRSSTKTKDEEEERSDDIGTGFGGSLENSGNTGISDASSGFDDGFVMPELPGDKTDFWEGPQWDAFGFFVQYMWAFGIVFAQGVKSNVDGGHAPLVWGVDGDGRTRGGEVATLSIADVNHQRPKIQIESTVKTAYDDWMENGLWNPWMGSDIWFYYYPYANTVIDVAVIHLDYIFVRYIIAGALTTLMFILTFSSSQLIACGIAVATYNEGAADFKQTPVYKESIQSRELLEEPESSNSDVFESNPTEEAPSLE